MRPLISSAGGPVRLDQLLERTQELLLQKRRQGVCLSNATVGGVGSV